jgi:hypothetical protein
MQEERGEERGRRADSLERRAAIPQTWSSETTEEPGYPKGLVTPSRHTHLPEAGTEQTSSKEKPPYHCAVRKQLWSSDITEEPGHPRGRTSQRGIKSRLPRKKSRRTTAV